MTSKDDNRAIFEFKYRQLKKYAHYLKAQLKSHSGESVRKGGTVERKLQIYKKLRKLIHYVDDDIPRGVNKWEDVKGVKQVDTYYSLLEKKLQKLQTLHSDDRKDSRREKVVEKMTDVKPASVYAKPEKIENEIVDSDVDDVKEDDGNDDDGDGSDADGSDTEVITEVGPTPQLNGRVLTIFDIQTSPDQLGISPIKGRVNNMKDTLGLMNMVDSLENDIFKTPSKPVSQSINVDGGNDLLKTLASSSRKLTFEDDVNVTPVKGWGYSNDNRIDETPKYLRTQSLSLKNVDEIIIGRDWSDDSDDGDIVSDMGGVSDRSDNDVNINDVVDLPDFDNKISNANVEPSPIIKKVGRSLFDIHKELVGLKRNLTDLEELVDEEDIVRDETKKTTDGVDDSAGINSTDEKKDIREDNDNDAGFKDDKEDDGTGLDEIETVFDPHRKLRNKVKTIKRSTRRARLRTDRLDLTDELETINIHALAFGRNGNNSEEKVEEEEDNEGDDSKKRKNPINNYDDEYDYAEEEEEYVRKDIKQLEEELNVGQHKGKRPGKHPLSNNFVRLNINRNRGGRYKRRR